MTDSARTPSRSYYRFTVGSFVISAFLHVFAVVAALGVMQPGLDMDKSVLERATYVAENVGLWRMGWHLWQLVALSNLIAAVSLCWYFSHARKQRTEGAGTAFFWSVLALLFTLAAIIPEQWGEYALVTSFVDEAREAVLSGSASNYVRLEARWIVLTTSCGAFGYTLMQACWACALVSFTRSYKRLKFFLLLSVTDFIAFMLSVFACDHACAPVLNGQLQYVDFHTIAVLNGIGFPVLFIWTLVFVAALGDRHHYFFKEESDQLHQVRFPTGSRSQWITGWLNSQGTRDVLRVIGTVLRTPVLKSDIRNVLYLNWLVPTERVRPWLPVGFAADERESMTAISILTYRHGGFGPRLLGPLRKLLPSPLQSNWRLYLKPVHGKRGAVYFFKTCMNSTLHVVGSRLMSDGLTSHKSGVFDYVVDNQQGHLTIESSGGSAPDLDLHFGLSESGGSLPATWQQRFGSWEEAVEYLVSQNRAVDCLGGWAATMESLIDIPIDPGQAVAVDVDSGLQCELIQQLYPESEESLFAFLIPQVTFRFLGESIRD